MATTLWLNTGSADSIPWPTRSIGETPSMPQHVHSPGHPSHYSMICVSKLHPPPSYRTSAQSYSPTVFYYTMGAFSSKPHLPSLPTILAAAHVGHEGIQKTLQRPRSDFYVPHARQEVRDFVQACVTCQRNKTEHLHPTGLLQPLEVPTTVWTDISMDFVEGLPYVHGKSVILSVIDRFSKYAHFIPWGHPYTAT